MTKAEAMELQQWLEGELIDAGIADVELSMALSGKLKCSFPNGYVTFYNDGELCFVSFCGFANELDDVSAAIKSCVQKYQDQFKRLAWSYEHIKELTGE